MASVVGVKLLLVVALAHLGRGEEQVVKHRMPGVIVEKGETYLCHNGALDPEQEFSIVEFLPQATMKHVHHILIYGCSEPGADEEIWNCGEMHTSSAEYKTAPPCSSGSQIVYAWARDAPALKLPEGVGFKVGGRTGINHLVLQVHYAVPVADPDKSGVDLRITDDRLPKSAGVYLLGTAGGIRPQTTEHFEAACQIEGDLTIHPFAFRTHTHKLGKVVSGYKVSPEGKWSLIGKKNPMLPQMFYPVADPEMTIGPGDTVAARCTMHNFRDHFVSIGATDQDEMCNFYMMYWVDGDRTLDQHQCFSYGPPLYYWEGLLSNPPNDFSEPNPEDAEHMERHH